MKHKNLTVNKLAFGNLKARGKQYTLMIIGIILAMTFSSGTIFFFLKKNPIIISRNSISICSSVRLKTSIFLAPCMYRED